MAKKSLVTRVFTDRIERLIASGFIPDEKISKRFAGKGHPGDAKMIDYLLEQLEIFIKHEAESIQEAG